MQEEREGKNEEREEKDSHKCIDKINSTNF